MKSFLPYVEKLEALLQGPQRSESEENVKLRAALDGEASRELAKLVALPQRRAAGAFFTGSKLTSFFFARSFDSSISSYFDPTCGAGDLILTAARTLPVKKSLRRTLEAWGRQLGGMDIHEEFIRAARVRLALLAISRGAASDITLSNSGLASLFPHLRVGDALAERSLHRHFSSFLLNPPFSPVVVNSECKWATGKITAAALFLEDTVRKAREGTRITAILPDVLRTGSRYARWRTTIEGLGNVKAVTRYGLFDRAADVDVFVLSLIKEPCSSISARWFSSPKSKNKTIGNHFLVSTGPFVPHRHGKNGQWHPYIHAKTATSFRTVKRLYEKVRFNGTLHVPPFVLVKRTSSPRDKRRATPVLVVGSARIQSCCGRATFRQVKKTSVYEQTSSFF
jgi:hypothetical protein